MPADRLTRKALAVGRAEAREVLNPHVTYVDLRGTLSVAADYKRWWANELHPTARGFASVTAQFANALAALP